jgi:SAM-dependent methyltransferase
MLNNQDNLSRVEREQDFHNQRFSDPSNRQKKVGRFYRITNSIQDEYKLLLSQLCRNKNVVEYGCGINSYAPCAIENGALKVVGIDISSVAIDQARMMFPLPNLSFIEMNAENLEFEKNSIDVVFGTGILHHLDLNQSMQSIVHVLRPDGRAVFVEPLGHNLFINMFRAKTPDIRSEDEHPLLIQDLDLFKSYFQTVNIKYFYLTSLLNAFFVDTVLFRVFSSMFEGIDRLLFRIPFLRKFAWQVLIDLSIPSKSKSKF